MMKNMSGWTCESNLQISIHIRRIAARCQNDPKCDADVKQSNSEAFKNNAEGTKTKVEAGKETVELFDDKIRRVFKAKTSRIFPSTWFSD